MYHIGTTVWNRVPFFGRNAGVLPQNSTYSTTCMCNTNVTYYTLYEAKPRKFTGVWMMRNTTKRIGAQRGNKGNIYPLLVGLGFVLGVFVLANYFPVSG